jgi:hypothetical protein
MWSKRTCPGSASSWATTVTTRPQSSRNSTKSGTSTRFSRTTCCPQQKLISKERRGAKVIKKHDAALTPHQRTVSHPGIRKGPVIAMNAQFKRLKPAALSRHILTLTGELEVLARAKAAPRNRRINTSFNPGPKRTFSAEATTHHSRTY